MLNAFALAAFFSFSFAAQAEKPAAPDKAAKKKAVKKKKTPEGLQELAIGDAAPDFHLKGIDGKMHALADYKASKVLCILFTCNHCPSAQALEKRLIQFTSDYAAKGVAVVAISPNDPKALRPNELGFSLYGDTYEDMIQHAKANNFNFPYLYDGDEQAAAKAYGCLATPHVFIFDNERKLRYKGRFDDSRFEDPKTIKTHDAVNAVNALLAGKKVPVEQTRPHGCSTKWSFKQGEAKKHEQTLFSTPVDVELIDADGVAALRKNDSNRLRLFNIWATWCGPCVQEFPDLVAVSRRFGLRDFEFITITLDKPDKMAKAKAFLEKMGAAPQRKLAKALKKEGRKTTHFLYNGNSTDDLAKALDPKWPGPIPYTVLVAPGGEILYRHSGMIDRDAMIERIVKLLGRFYTPAPAKK